MSSEDAKVQIDYSGLMRRLDEAKALIEDAQVTPEKRKAVLAARAQALAGSREQVRPAVLTVLSFQVGGERYDQEWPQACDPRPIERDEYAEEHGRSDEPRKIEPARIEQRDDQHRTDIVDDGDGQQEQAQYGRNALSEQTDDTHRECDVGRGGNCPPALQTGLSPGNQEVNHSRCRHARDRGQQGQAALLCRRELPLDQAAEAYRLMDSREALKVLLRP